MENFKRGGKMGYVFGEGIASEYPDVKVSIERIYPEIAERMLECNVHNRKPKKTAIHKDIADGRWAFNGETIVFSNDGTLLDGQNRLMACVKAGKPIDTVVVRGVEGVSQLTMDAGAKRTVADQLKILGIRDNVSVAAIALSLNKLDSLGIKRCFYFAKGDDVSTASTVEFAIENLDSRIMPIKNDVDRVKKKYHVNSTVIAALFDRFRAIDEDDYREFVDQLLFKSDMCQPVRLLADRLTKNADDVVKKTKHLTGTVIAAYIVKTWNAYMQGEEIGVLKFRPGGKDPETFPEIYGGES